MDLTAQRSLIGIFVDVNRETIDGLGSIDLINSSIG